MARETRTTMQARLTRLEDGRIELRAPSVGKWREGPPIGALVRPGLPVGYVEILGVAHELVAPEGASGVVVEERDPHDVRRAVSFDDVLLVLDPKVAGEVAARDIAAAEGASHQGLAFTAAMSGRFYRRASPDKPAFVEEGAVIEVGHTVCLLEVMKTFNRITYGGPKLPERAKVLRVVPADGADVDEGDVLLELEPA